MNTSVLNRQRIKHSMLAATGLLLAGCVTNQAPTSYQTPVLNLPTDYQYAPLTVNDGLPVPLAVWWRMLQSPELDALIDRGLANNADLRMATLRMAQAKVQLEQARLGTLPEVKAPLGLGLGSSANSAATIVGNWKVDLWGEQRSTVDAARFVLWQAVFERDNQQRNLVSQIVSSYLQLLQLNERIRISHHSETLLDEMLTSIQQRMALGDATTLELDQQLSALFAARAAIPALQEQREQLLISLAGLLGTLPGELSLSQAGLDQLELPATLPPLPSSLLLQRPDVRVAESKLLAADANIHVARARLLPSLDLAGQLGSSLSLSKLFQPSALFLNAMATLTVSIFNRDKQRQEIERTKLVQEEMLESYAKTLYQGARDVESALSSIEQNRKRLSFQQEVTASAKRAWDHSAEMYKIGSLDYLSLLNAENLYLRYLDELLRQQFELSRGYVRLFESLGGGVESADSTATLPLANASQQPQFYPVNHRLNQDGIDWEGDKLEPFWLLELPGLHQRNTVAPVWRDLRNRFPELMDNRFVRPKLFDQIEAGQQQVAWYRLYVGKFDSPEQAEQLCGQLKNQYQRCRVVSSRSIHNKDD